MTWLGLLVDALVTLVYRTNREEERLVRGREEQRIRDIEESDKKLRDELEAMGKKRAK